MILSAYTPTYERPAMLELCEASVKAQTVPVEHVIVRDEVGIGIDGVYAAIPDNAYLVTGDYVMVLSDDNVLTDPRFAEDLAARVLIRDWPDVVMFRGECGDSVQPLAWQHEPVINQVDLSCFAVLRPVWVENAHAWGHRYEGDFDFIHHLWTAGYRFDWWDRMVFRALQISRGAPEAVA